MAWRGLKTRPAPLLSRDEPAGGKGDGRDRRGHLESEKAESMKTKNEVAAEKFLAGYNCAQSVLYAYGSNQRQLRRSLPPARLAFAIDRRPLSGPSTLNHPIAPRAGLCSLRLSQALSADLGRDGGTQSRSIRPFRRPCWSRRRTRWGCGRGQCLVPPSARRNTCKSGSS